MTLHQFKKLLPFWKKVLSIEDWTVTVRWGSAKELSHTGDACDGLNHYYPEHLTSEILLSKTADEVVLVHELLHLVFDGHKRDEDEPYSTLHERAINVTARALVALKNKS